jgi:hypothetical protein
VHEQRDRPAGRREVQTTCPRTPSSRATSTPSTRPVSTTGEDSVVDLDETFGSDNVDDVLDTSYSPRSARWR